MGDGIICVPPMERPRLVNVVYVGDSFRVVERVEERISVGPNVFVRGKAVYFRVPCFLPNYAPVQARFCVVGVDKIVLLEDYELEVRYRQLAFEREEECRMFVLVSVLPNIRRTR